MISDGMFRLLNCLQGVVTSEITCDSASENETCGMFSTMYCCLASIASETDFQLFCPTVGLVCSPLQTPIRLNDCAIYKTVISGPDPQLHSFYSGPASMAGWLPFV